MAMINKKSKSFRLKTYNSKTGLPKTSFVKKLSKS